MKIEKAIDIIEHELPLYLSNPQTPLMHAITLAVEALKVIKNLRQTPIYFSKALLPGETKD